VNCCDGSSIALLAGIIHRVRFNTYTGPEVFAKFTQEPFRQLFLGNTSEVHNLLHSQFRLNSIDTSQMFFETLPFKNVDEFEYDEIAKRINSISPDIIWVSLGAPKQEYFIHKLYPFIDKGIFIAIGAAFNFYINTNHNRRAPSLFLRLKLEWLYRSLKDPKRIGRRAISYALLLPSIIVKEIFKVYFKGKNKS
jgi:N-acetylglucosaminyldiphosphoundecaprenol N-acetyl-beta-D-mannosaminyltransferase